MLFGGECVHVCVDFQYALGWLLLTMPPWSSRPTKPHQPASRSIEKPTRHLRRKVLCHGIVRKATFMHDMASRGQLFQLLILENFYKVRGNQPSIHHQDGGQGNLQSRAQDWFNCLCLTQTPCSTQHSSGRVYSVKRRNKQPLAQLIGRPMAH
ncbi:hypothetical protein V8C34DRAFT_278705 [Trichoderma compactum]